MPTQLFQVDAFTARPFTGNPAAVCLLQQSRDDHWLQAVAAEMNLSETAFLLPEADGWNLRWFTPSVEVDLCGHATLASAHVLWQQHLLAGDAIARFHTRSGLLTAARHASRIELQFPMRPMRDAEAPRGLLEALGVRPRYVGCHGANYLVELDDTDAVVGLEPDFTRLRRVEARGVMVTARDDSGRYDFVSRFFAPAVGIDEDPVTGSAHCSLAPHWAARLGKTELAAYQASHRGGTVHVRVAEDRVLLGGAAVTVVEGVLHD
jgi:PhzF family phenazine biosynthesis protein